MSSSDIAVSVQGLSKSYSIAHNAMQHTTVAEALMHRVKNPRQRVERETFWALKDVNFEVKKGEVVGIIGRNGAGKSTLLKILSRITMPTTGQIDLYGRVGSLLEVGTGFHPELTGRENIFLNGAILGMTRREIAREFDAIVDFAGTEKFLDTPVKRYSSGMYVRLAFAVAAHLEPEILIVDEVLAVGDTEFQKKCMGKMQDVASSGRTILFVSHNMQAVSALTSTCVFLSQGVCEFIGPTRAGIAEYMRNGSNEAAIYTVLPSPTEPRVTSVEVKTSSPNSVQGHMEPMDVVFEITTPVPVDSAAISFQVINEQQQPVTHLLTLDSEIPMCRKPGVYRLTCHIPTSRLYIGNYTVNVYFAERQGGKLFQRIENVCPFEVVVQGHIREYYWQPGAATYVEDAAWQVENVEANLAMAGRER